MSTLLPLELLHTFKTLFIVYLTYGDLNKAKVKGQGHSQNWCTRYLTPKNILLHYKCIYGALNM